MISNPSNGKTPVRSRESSYFKKEGCGRDWGRVMIIFPLSFGWEAEGQGVVTWMVVTWMYSICANSWICIPIYFSELSFPPLGREKKSESHRIVLERIYLQ